MSTSNSRMREADLRRFRNNSNYYNKKLNRYHCQGHNCGRLLTDFEVRVDHINNNNADNRPRNKQPLCNSCNIEKDMKKWNISEKERYKRGLVQQIFKKRADLSPQLLVNRNAQPLFDERAISYTKESETGVVEWDEMLDECCQHCKINGWPVNQKTAENYLRQLVTKSGPLLSTGIGKGSLIELKNKSSMGPS